MLCSTWCKSPNCSKCRASTATTPPSLTSPCMPAQLPVLFQVLNTMCGTLKCQFVGLDFVVCKCYITLLFDLVVCNILHVSKCGYVTSCNNGWCVFLFGVQEVTMDDKSAVKAKGLWEDWHMRQAVDQAVRANHRSGIHYLFLSVELCFCSPYIILSLRFTYWTDLTCSWPLRKLSIALNVACLTGACDQW